MSKHKSRTGSERPADRSEAMEKVRAKRKASAMATVKELADALGIGLNKAYELVNTKQVHALRFESKTAKDGKQRRFLIPRAEIARLTGGTGTAPTAA
jgi:hypothetical protein